MLFPPLILASALLVVVEFPATINALRIPRAAPALYSPIVISSRVASSVYNDDSTADMAVPNTSTVFSISSSDGNAYPACGSPSISTALAFTLIFGVLTIAHTGQAIYYSKPYTYPLLTSTLWAFLSFLLLTVSLSLPHSNVILSLLSSNLLLIVPLWLTTYLHLLLPHLSNYFLPTRSLLNLRAPVLRALSILFTLPIAVLQVLGTMKGVEENADGWILYTLGVALQGLGIVIFIAMLGVLHREVRDLENAGVLGTGKEEWRGVVWAGYGNAGLVLIILLSRLIHLLSPSTGTSTNKQHIFILEVIPLLLATISSNVLHPGRIMVGEEEMERLWGGGKEEFRYTRGVASDATASNPLEAEKMRGNGVEDGYEDRDRDTEIDERERGRAEEMWMYEIESRMRYYNLLRDEV
ncbi:hypothetical protein ACMFMG_008232 [Clarireedia jacksonii]